MIGVMDMSETFRLAEQIAAASAGAIADAGWEKVNDSLVGNDPDLVVIMALEAFQVLRRPIPAALMDDIMAYLHLWSGDTDLWERATNTGLVVDDRQLVAV